MYHKSAHVGTRIQSCLPFNLINAMGPKISLWSKKGINDRLAAVNSHVAECFRWILSAKGCELMPQI